MFPIHDGHSSAHSVTLSTHWKLNFTTPPPPPLFLLLFYYYFFNSCWLLALTGKGLRSKFNPEPTFSHCFPRRDLIGGLASERGHGVTHTASKCASTRVVCYHCCCDLCAGIFTVTCNTNSECEMLTEGRSRSPFYVNTVRHGYRF